MTPTQLLVLREVADKPGWARLAARRSLTTVVTITSKKKRPELITFKYGVNDGDGMTVTDLDRSVERAGRRGVVGEGRDKADGRGLNCLKVSCGMAVCVPTT